MIRLRVLLLYALFVVSLPSASHGQICKGAVELMMAGSVEGMDLSVHGRSGDAYWSGSVEGSVGYLISQSTEFGGDLSLTFGEGEVGYGSYGAFASRHFHGDESAKLVPFVGLRVGSRFNGITILGRQPVAYGLFGGVKAFVTDGAAIAVWPYYTLERRSGSSVRRFGVKTGVSLFLK